MAMYRLGSMEDVLRTTLRTYAPARTGDPEKDRQSTERFIEEVQGIIYRMQEISSNAYPRVVDE